MTDRRVSTGADTASIIAAVEEALDSTEPGTWLEYSDLVSRFGVAGSAAFYRLLAKRYLECEGEECEVIAAQSLAAEAYALREAGNLTEADVPSETLIARFSTSANPEIQRLVATALSRKAAKLWHDERKPEATSVYERIDSLYRDSNDPVVVAWAAEALFYRASSLWHVTRHRREAVELLGELLTRYGETADVEIKTTVHRALLNRARMLVRRGRLYAAMRDAHSLYGRHKAATEPEVRAVVDSLWTFRLVRRLARFRSRLNPRRAAS